MKSIFNDSGGKNGQKTRLRHTNKGKLLARDRIKYLLDHKLNFPNNLNRLLFFKFRFLFKFSIFRVVTVSCV